MAVSTAGRPQSIYKLSHNLIITTIQSTRSQEMQTWGEDGLCYKSLGIRTAQL